MRPCSAIRDWLYTSLGRLIVVPIGSFQKTVLGWARTPVGSSSTPSKTASLHGQDCELIFCTLPCGTIIPFPEKFSRTLPSKFSTLKTEIGLLLFLLIGVLLRIQIDSWTVPPVF